MYFILVTAGLERPLSAREGQPLKQLPAFQASSLEPAAIVLFNQVLALYQLA